VTVRRIRYLGDPVLRQQAQSVTSFDRELRALVADLTDTMLDAHGGGIAAPQIGVGLRVFTYHVDGVVGHVVNPQVTVVGEEEQLGPEGCLSIPGLPFDCRRWLRVVTTGFTEQGESLTLPGTGRLAMVAQHETDHLDGVLFVDRLDPETQARAIEAIRAAEWSDAAAPVVRLSPHAPLRRSGSVSR